MKARYQYRFYPSNQQQVSLAQLFGCVRVVWNDALVTCKQALKLPSNNDLQKLVITQAKKTQEREWLSDVSNIPLQQSVADLGVAYKNFFDSLKGRRKGERVLGGRIYFYHNCYSLYTAIVLLLCMVSTK